MFDDSTLFKVEKLLVILYAIIQHTVALALIFRKQADIDLKNSSGTVRNSLRLIYFLRTQKVSVTIRVDMCYQES